MARRGRGHDSVRLAVAAIPIGWVILATPFAADAAVSITAPGPVDLGAVPTGAGTYSARLGTVTASATGIAGILLPSFVATVSSTTFTTGGKTTAETISRGSLSYWSGPVTTSTGTQTAVPGQLAASNAVTLSTARTAFSSSGLVTTITTSWNPTIAITIPPAAVAGTYTGTITHSVA